MQVLMNHVFMQELKVSIYNLSNKRVTTSIFIHMYTWKILGLLRKEVDRVEMFQYFGIECDSDDEIEEDESDAEYFSDDQVVRRAVNYDLEKMFEIIKKRDFNNWSMDTIHNHYTKVDTGNSGRMQLTR